jgi:hypothetical protein
MPPISLFPMQVARCRSRLITRSNVDERLVQIEPNAADLTLIHHTSTFVSRSKKGNTAFDRTPFRLSNSVIKSDSLEWLYFLGWKVVLVEPNRHSCSNRFVLVQARNKFQNWDHWEKDKFTELSLYIVRACY